MKIQAVSDVRQTAKSDSSKSSGSSFGAQLDAAKANQSNPAAELQAYVDMTPAQRLRASALQSLGLKESDLAGMSPEERQEIEDKIAAFIRAKMEQETEKKALRIG